MGKLRACSNMDSPSTMSVSTHPKTVATTKVPSSHTSQELSMRNDQAKPPSSDIASSASPESQTAVAASLASVWENRDRNETDIQSQFTTVPDSSAALPLAFNETQSPKQLLATGQKQACCSLVQTSALSPKPKREGQTGLNVQKCMTLPGKSGADSRSHAATSTTSVGLEPSMTVCHQDLFVNGQQSMQHPTDKLTCEAQDCSSLPSVPPRCLTLCEHQGTALKKDVSGLNVTKLDINSTRETTTARRGHAAKIATKVSRAKFNHTRISASSSPLQVVGCPPAVMTVATNSKPQATDVNKQAPGSQCPTGGTQPVCRQLSPPADSLFPNGPMPTVNSASVSATQEEQLIQLDAIPGALVGSVTTKISAIHLTKQGQLTCISSSGPGDTPPPGLECAPQVDGGEEELPDELENACSDDDDSDCSSIIGTSSSASLGLLSGVEEPMSLEVEDDREEKPALVPSVFPHFPPTLYFSNANEKVELLPTEQRRLLKWKMSAVTPNIVKNIIARSHFRVTKKSHDWLGCWGHHMKPPAFKALAEHQKLNHFPGTFQIGRKDRLWRNLSKMQARFGKQEFNFFPRTFVLPQDIKLLRKAWEDGGSRQKWIIKPPASARGIGIQVIHKWSQMPRKRPLLVQKYLHKPYLISGNKFDLRIYVYVTSYDPLRIYIFPDGLVRFASCKYSSSMKTLSNKFMHLTNYSVNKKNSEYQANSDDKACQGHKWALKALWQHLEGKGVNTSLIWEKIKDIVIKTVIASEPYVYTLLKTNVRAAYSCHELFGFDIMLDEKLKPWILEVNVSPSLHSHTALDVSIKGQMIKDLLNLAGFRIPQKEDVVTPCSSASSSTSSLCCVSRGQTEPDEKVKRAFYLTQRYADQEFLSTVLDVLTPEDVRVLAESEDELSRKGEFERIFPSQSASRYLRFFECPRYFSLLLDQWEQKHWNNRTKGINLLRTLCEKGVHLGTSDPAHMWSKCSYVSKFEPRRQEPSIPSSVVVCHQHHFDREGEGPAEGRASVSSLPQSESPGSSVASSACASPQPSL